MSRRCGSESEQREERITVSPVLTTEQCDHGADPCDFQLAASFISTSVFLWKQSAVEDFAASAEDARTS